MAVLVTKTDVKQVIDTDLGDTDLDYFISLADLEIVEKLTGKGLSDARLKEIERWLTAHFIASSRDPQIKSEGVDVLSSSYEGQTGMGLEFTRYGQQVMKLDTSGTLGRSGKGGVELQSI